MFNICRFSEKNSQCLTFAGSVKIVMITFRVRKAETPT